MDVVLTYLQQVDFPTLIVMGAMLWFFKSRMDIKFDKLDCKLSKEIKVTRDELRHEMKVNKDELKDEIKLLRIEVQDIDRRLCRLEGAFSNKDCCMIKDHRIQEKVE